MPTSAEITTDPGTAPDATVDAARFRERLTQLTNWLTKRPWIRIESIDYLSSDGVEFSLGAGRFEIFTTSTAVVDALVDATITVTAVDTLTEDDTARCCEILIKGVLPGTDSAVDITAICFDLAATALVASLGAPPVPGVRRWTTTAAHLRSLVPAAGA